MTSFPSLLAYLAFTAILLTSAQAQYLRPGAIICTAGYLMDNKTINEDLYITTEIGDVEALVFPDRYPVSKLVDSQESIEEPWYILKPPQYMYREEPYTPEWKIMDKTLVIDMVREIGICETCYGFGYMETGFQIEVVGMIMSYYPPTLDIREMKLYDPEVEVCRSYDSESPTNSPTGTPSISPTNAPSASPTEKGFTYPPTPRPSKPPTRTPTPAPTEAPTPIPTVPPTAAPSSPPSIQPSLQPSVAPSSMPSVSPTQSIAPTTPPSIMPSVAPTGIPLTDCSQYQQTFRVPNLPITIHYVVNTLQYTNKAEFSAQVVYTGNGWLGFGLSPNGAMTGSSVVIGSVTPSWNVQVNPGKYFLGGPAQSLITPMDKQTLSRESIVQNATHTVLTFTKLLEEEGEPTINSNGLNTFVVAHGFTNTFGYHEGRAVFQMELTPCIPEVFDNVLLVKGGSNMTNATSNSSDFFIDMGPGSPVQPEQWIPFEPTNELMSGRVAGNKNGHKPHDAFANAGYPSYDGYQEVSEASQLLRISTMLLGLAMCLFA